MSEILGHTDPCKRDLSMVGFLEIQASFSIPGFPKNLLLRGKRDALREKYMIKKIKEEKLCLHSR
jgi:hypothetical protein